MNTMQSSNGVTLVATGGASKPEDDDNLDIPAFMRRTATKLKGGAATAATTPHSNGRTIVNPLTKAELKAPDVEKGAKGQAIPGTAKGAPIAPKKNAPGKPSAKPTEKPAQKGKGAPKPEKTARPRKPSERSRYDWAGARERAAKGVIPAAPDFSANTHKSYRPLLAQVEALVKAKDLPALQALKIKGTCTSPSAVKRYREIAIVALKAKSAK